MAMPSDSAPPASPGGSGLLSQKDYARRRGWSKQYVNQLVKQGRIPLVNGRIDPAAADAALAGMRDPSRGPRSSGRSQLQATSALSYVDSGPVPGIHGTFAKARTLREHFRAMREKMEFEVAKGEMLPRRDVENAAYELGVLFRERMLRAATTIGEDVAARFGVKPEDAVELVTSGVTQALQALANNVRGHEWGIDKGLMRDSVAADDAR